MPKFLGVKNELNDPVVLTHDGEQVRFGAGEIRIVDESAANHAAKRAITGHADPKNFKSPIVTKKVFSLLSLADALKAGASMDEGQDPVGAVKKEEVKKENERKAIAEQVIKDLKAQGWKAPEAAAKK